MNTKTWIATGRNTPSHRPGALSILAVGLWRFMRSGYARARQRRSLVALSDHQLRDVGLTRSDVEQEVIKPFWRS